MGTRFFWILALILLPASVWATDAPLVGDASVSSANPSLNFGSLPNLTVGNGNVGLVQFDLSTLPANTTNSSVLKATLQIFVNRAGTSGMIEVSAVASAWSESAVDYSTMPGSGSTIGTASGAAGEYVSFDVTSQVQEWVAAPSTNFGFALKSSGLFYLDSKESITTSHPAKLDITVAGAPAGDGYVMSPHGITNTAAGASSLNDPSGFFNTAFGQGTLGASAGSVYNTAIGNGALQNSTTGSVNTAVGAGALSANTTGQWNQAVGAFALTGNTSGQYNTGVGFYASSANTTGYDNAAFGSFTLYSATIGSQNTAIGDYSGFYATTGSYNTYLGYGAGEFATTGSHNIMIGNEGTASDSKLIRIGDNNQTKTFMAGIRGTTTGVSNGVDVVIDSNGQLGTINSSRRFKKDISDMGDASDGLMKLRPVTFHYKQASADGVDRLEYGLIAEEVAKVYPDAVTYTPAGETETIQYHKINAMMLNELQKQERTILDQSKEIEKMQQRIDALERIMRSEPAEQNQ